MNSRIERVISAMKERGLTQMIVCDPQSIAYLTEVYNQPEERFYAFLIRNDGWHTLFANKLFNVPAIPYEVVRYDDTDDQISMLAEKIDSSVTLGVDKEWRARFLLPLAEKYPNLKMVVASDCVDDNRAIKDEEEIKLMIIASEINDRVMENVSKFIKEGMSEKEVAEFLKQDFINEGADADSFPAIVSFGANAADPHHGPDDTILKKGDVVLIDMGCKYHGYCSDMTRTFFCKEASEDQLEIHDLVREANEYAESVIKPGVKLCDIDSAARGMIAEKGYGPNFNHRLGHFIGRDVHEKGDVSATNQNVVKPGMIFSIEPGIYLEGYFGVRVEDLVLVTEDGCQPLNKVDKKYKFIG